VIRTGGYVGRPWLRVSVGSFVLQQDGAVGLTDAGGEFRVPVTRRGPDFEDDWTALTQFLDATLGLHLAGCDNAHAVAEPLDQVQLVGAEEHRYSALGARSEEHTSELQSRFELVCR